MNKLSGLTDVPPSVARNIGDKVNAKRKDAALEIEKMVKKKVAAGEGNDDILALVDTLASKYTRPTCSANERKGGMLSLAAVAVGLAGSGSLLCQSKVFVERLLPPLLAGAVDADGRVRYYALEAVYNVVKSTRPAILAKVPSLFEVLFKLCDDTDTCVQNATIFVSDLLKDSIAGSPSYRVGMLLETLVSCMPVQSSDKRRFLLGWISFIDSLPTSTEDFVASLPDVVPMLLAYSGDSVPEVRHPADKQLRHILGDIKGRSVEAPVQDLTQALSDSILNSEDDSTSALPSVLSDASTDSHVKAETLKWLDVLVEQYYRKLGFTYPKILKCCLKCLDSADFGVQDVALELNGKLQSNLRKTEELNFLALLDVAVQKIGSVQELAKLEALKWTALLMKTDYIAAKQIKPLVLHSLCDALSSASDEVVQQAVVVLSALSSVDQEGLSLTTKTIVRVFEGPSGAMLLKRRGSIILDKLCDMIAPDKLLISLVKQVARMQDKDISRMITQAVNLLLLTSSKTQGCRMLLSKSQTDKEAAIFTRNLFSGFASSISASLSLVLLSKYYELASLMVESLADFPLIAGMAGSVVELSHLVNLIESPAFASVRLNLIDTAKYPALTRTMVSILMILPQGKAFESLSKRLQSLPSTKTSDIATKKISELSTKERDMLDSFIAAQLDRIESIQ